MIVEDYSDLAALRRGGQAGRETVLTAIVAEAAWLARRPAWMPDLWATLHTRRAARIGWMA